MSSPILTLDSAGPFVNDRYVLSFQAASALAAGTVVKFTGTGIVGPVSAVTDIVLGVVWNDVRGAGMPTSVITRGEVVVTSDNAVTAGDLLIAGASGQVHSIGASSASTGTSLVRGQAVDTQGTAGTAFKAIIY
jgi:hypothetical protein